MDIPRVKLSDVRPKRKTLESVCTPIFDAAMGERMALMRMALHWDQKTLGEKLNLSQQVVSRLETGRLKTCEHPFTVEKFKEIFGDRTSHILYGTGMDRFNSGFIRAEYWREKLKRKEKRPKQLRLR